jgi:penicillin amidase
MVYADVDGNIGYFMPGWTPLRKNGDGSVPEPGDTDEFEWTGYIRFEDLPQVLNPPDGVIATANARVVGPEYKFYLTDRWDAPYRTDRLYQLLSEGRNLTPADANAIQNDIVSTPNLFIAKQLLAADHAHPSNDAALRSIMEKLKNWDGRARRDSVQTSLLQYTRARLLQNILQPVLGAHLNEYVWWRHDTFLENVLRDRSAWWLPQGYATYDELLMRSAEQAIGQLAARTKSHDASAWEWGNIHQLEMLHPLGASRALRRFLNIGPYAEDGTNVTVRALDPHFGPAMRYVADLSNWDNSYMEIPTGESGQYGSPHYRDQFPEWFGGRPIAAPFTEAAEERVRAHRLELLPAGNGGATPVSK